MYWGCKADLLGRWPPREAAGCLWQIYSTHCQTFAIWLASMFLSQFFPFIKHGLFSAELEFIAIISIMLVNDNYI